MQTVMGKHIHWDDTQGQGTPQLLRHIVVGDRVLQHQHELVPCRRGIRGEGEEGERESGRMGEWERGGGRVTRKRTRDPEVTSAPVT